jgi:hypothetical protein
VKDLPKFKAQKREDVICFMTQVLTHPNKPEESYFRRLIEYEDGHYGVEFSLDYFRSTEVPTKSQWNSLKKKLKRHDKKAFVFKEHALISCNDPHLCGVLEFGFFAH